MFQSSSSGRETDSAASGENVAPGRFSASDNSRSFPFTGFIRFHLRWRSGLLLTPGGLHHTGETQDDTQRRQRLLEQGGLGHSSFEKSGNRATGESYFQGPLLRHATNIRIEIQGP